MFKNISTVGGIQTVRNDLRSKNFWWTNIKF